MMKNKKMTTGKCKFTNSFIHANKMAVVAVCHENSNKKNSICISKNQFRVTTCRKQGKTDSPPCNYKAENFKSCINITCDNNKPVHFSNVVPLSKC
ncbi:RNAS1 Ribonuclease, partial [Polypterus senegalus]|nr:RNAS1 Ribonuclease [Polypterus senegalus]